MTKGKNRSLDKTREVLVGNVGVGGNNPIRIQSMTTSPTHDVDKTIDQIMKLSDIGCEIARVTVQGKREADACEWIKNGLIKKGYSIPLVADIHFYPPAAMRVVDFVDKVRINPGNFLDRRATFKQISYTDESYELEKEKIFLGFSPLVEKCKRLHRAIRIGTNHGSLSDRIMNRYGDTTFGMVESALEFVDVCRDLDFHDLIFSMKASNPIVMIEAYRLLKKKFIELGYDYPFHLGVTEAGDGEDGRIKSAVGIGSLLLDGIGDTIRVSLTEDPWHEIDPCKRLIKVANEYRSSLRDIDIETNTQYINERLIKIGNEIDPSLKEKKYPYPLHRDGSVILPMSAFTQSNSSIDKDTDLDSDLNSKLLFSDAESIDENLHLLQKAGEQSSSESKMDALYLDKDLDESILLRLSNQEIGLILKNESTSPIQNDSASPIQNHNSNHNQNSSPSLVQHSSQRGTTGLLQAFSLESIQDIKDTEDAKGTDNEGSGGRADSENILKEEHGQLSDKKLADVYFLTFRSLHETRAIFQKLESIKDQTPVIIFADYSNYSTDYEDFVIKASAEIGAILADGYGDGVCISAPFAADDLKNFSFALLQAVRKRSSKTEFIACPGCGRTLFDLQSVTQRIREKTGHLPGVKIAVMGCIVNGPGEMADADFGYVGSRSEKIDLYVGKAVVERGIDFKDADARLIELIKTHGRWVDPISQKKRRSGFRS